MSDVCGSPENDPAWVLTTIGALGRLHCGQSPPSAAVNTNGDGTPYVSGPEQWDGHAIHMGKWTTVANRVAPANSIFITVKGAGVGTLFPGIDAAIGRDIYAFEPHESIDAGFIRRALQFSINDVIVKARGDIPGLSKSHILDHPITLAGPKTQLKVSSKIDELFSRIDEGECALERVQTLVERYRQSVLKAAVTGELTREWREKQKDKLESGDALLAHILTARRDAWEKAELGKMKAKGITPKGDNWKQKYKEPLRPDTTELPELPEGWIWGSIDQIGFVSGGLTKNQKRADRALTRPYLRVANVYANRLDLAEVHEIGVSESELERVVLRAGDMLVVEGNGSINQIGRVALWDGSIDGCVHQNHLIKVRCTQVLPSWYLLIWCMSPKGRDLIRKVASSTAGLHTLSISKVQALPVPIPSADELTTILDCFAQMDSLVVSQQSAISSEARKSESLRQSILKAAFSGALVPQLPTDESATTLLCRITADRAATPRKPKRGTKSKKKIFE